jgi:putative phage-type endonuclease
VTIVAASVTSIGLTHEQVEARKRGIGGSDAAAVLGIDPYRTPLDIYELKLGLKQPDPPNAAMKRGIHLEGIARGLYRELTGRKIRRLRQQAHPTYSFMLCNVDGEIVGDDRGRGVFEAKCPGLHSFAKIEREGLPLHWITQLAHNMEVTGCTWGSFAIFSAELWRLIHFDVPRDEDLARALVQAERVFWHEHVLAKVPPTVAVNTAPELLSQLARAQQDAGAGELIVRSDAEWAEAAEMYLQAKEILESGEHLVETAKQKLQELMAGFGATEGAGLRCYFTQQPGRTSFDKKALAAARPLDREKVLAVIAEYPDGLRALELVGRLDVAGLDLSVFEKVGKPFERFAAYQVKAGVGD